MQPIEGKNKSQLQIVLCEQALSLWRAYFRTFFAVSLGRIKKCFTLHEDGISVQV